MVGWKICVSIEMIDNELDAWKSLRRSGCESKMSYGSCFAFFLINKRN